MPWKSWIRWGKNYATNFFYDEERARRPPADLCMELGQRDNMCKPNVAVEIEDTAT